METAAIALSTRSVERMQAVVAQRVDDLIRDYKVMLERTRDGNAVTDTDWAFVKRVHQLRVFQRLKTSMAVPPPDPDLVGNRLQVPDMLAVGAVEGGSLHDLMHALVSCSNRDAAIKSVVTDDALVHSTLLSTVVAPTPSEPFESLNIKRSLLRKPRVIGHLMRDRDIVYLEATGITNIRGTHERVGYHVIQSVELPAVRELHERGIVRATASMAYIFIEEPVAAAQNAIRVLGQGAINPLGDIPTPLAAKWTCDSLLAVDQLLPLAHLKKLTRMAQLGARQWSDCDDNLPSYREEDLGSTLRDTTTAPSCRICGRLLCSKCCARQQLAAIPALAKTPLEHAVTVCDYCIDAAALRDAREFAAHDAKEALALAPSPRYVARYFQPHPDTPTSSHRQRAASGFSTLSSVLRSVFPSPPNNSAGSRRRAASHSNTRKSPRLLWRTRSPGRRRTSRELLGLNPDNIML